MPTGMTTTEGQHVMNTALFETIFVEDVRKLGPAIARAKRELLANGDAYFEQVSQTFLLFGDPAMQLRVPLPRRPAGLAPAFWTKSGVALSWDAALDCNNDPVAGYNVYRSTSPTGNFTKINNAAITGGGIYRRHRQCSGGGGLRNLLLHGHRGGCRWR